MEYLNDIWQYIHPLIHWGVFVLVILLGRDKGAVRN